MKVEELKISVYTYKTEEDLPPEALHLCEKAKNAAHDAYAPYSNFKVGAAAELANGEIVCGNNQENSAYPSGLCAERVAVFHAGAKYPDVAINRIAVAALKNDIPVEVSVYPCGSCRQVLLEYEKRGEKDLEVIMYGSKETRIVKSVKDLLPLPFISLVNK